MAEQLATSSGLNRRYPWPARLCRTAIAVLGAVSLALGSLACEPDRIEPEEKATQPAGLASAPVAADEPLPTPPSNPRGPFEITWKNPIRQWNDFSSGVHFNPDGSRLLVWFDGQGQVWDTQKWMPAGPRIDYGSVIETAALSADGTKVLANRRITDITVHENGGKMFHHRGDEWRVWDARTGKPAGPGVQITFNRHDRDTFSIAAMSPDGRLVAAAAGPKTMRVYRADSGAVERTLELPEKAYDMYFAADGKTLLVVDWKRQLSVWDLTTGDRRATMESGTTRFEFYANGRIASESLNTLRVLDIQSGQILLDTESVGDEAIGVEMCISPTGGHVAIEILIGEGVMITDYATEIWDVDRRVRLGRIPALRARALDPEGAVVVVATLQNFPPHRSAIHDAQTGAIVRELGGFIAQAAFSPDGTLLAVIMDDQVRVLKADPGKTGAIRWAVDEKK